MSPLDALWHLLNLFGPALGLGLLAPSLAKLLWRQALMARPWADLAGWTVAACAVVTVLGLVVYGRDGKMLSYVAMVLATTATLWWRGWGRRGH
jgi:hypothetical protein